MFFKCKHPFKYLIVQKDATTKNIDADFNHVTYHLSCRWCKKKLDINYAEMIGGTEAFLAR